MPNPILVSFKRGELVETIFRGAFVIVDEHHRTIESAGNIFSEIYPRSSLKPIQALAVLESGAAASFDMTLEQIALACSSHNGELVHTSIVEEWLASLDVRESQLECGVHPPLDKETAKELERQGIPFSEKHNTCSGKHLGFITLGKHLKVDLKGYSDLSHPVQKRIGETVARLTKIELSSAPIGIDGCQVPVIGMPLISLAKGMATLCSKSAQGRSAERQIIEAMLTYPYLIAGKKRYCTRIMEKFPGKLIIKMGADGVFSAIIPDKKWGISLKIDDGNLKAAEVAMSRILQKYVFPEKDLILEGEVNPKLKNWNKTIVGNYFTDF